MDETKRDSPDDLHGFAKAMVLKLIRRHHLDRDDYRIEDAVQELFLAGWQVWCDTENIGLAKNRMVSRKKNLIRNFASEKKHEPKLESEFEPIRVPSLIDGKTDEEDWLEQKIPIGGKPCRQALDETEDILQVRQILAKLSPRRSRVCQFIMADMTNAEIAREMGISERTVERERKAIRKDYENEYGTPKRFRPKR